MKSRAGRSAGAALALAAALAGCASQEVPVTTAPGEVPAGEPRFEVNAAGAVGIALLTTAVVFALLVASDDALSFD
jgi:hypothetical protein